MPDWEDWDKPRKHTQERKGVRVSSDGKNKGNREEPAGKSCKGQPVESDKRKPPKLQTYPQSRGFIHGNQGLIHDSRDMRHLRFNSLWFEDFP